MLVFLMLITSAIAEDLIAMATDELVQLRHSINLELARRTDQPDAQVIRVGDLCITLYHVFLGTGNNDEPVIAIMLSVDNLSDSTVSVFNLMECNVTQHGIELDTTFVRAEGLPSSAVSDSILAMIKPGAKGAKLTYSGVLLDNTSEIELDFFLKQAKSQDPYCGTFTIDLSTY